MDVPREEKEIQENECKQNLTLEIHLFYVPIIYERIIKKKQNKKTN